MKKLKYTLVFLGFCMVATLFALAVTLFGEIVTKCYLCMIIGAALAMVFVNGRNLLEIRKLRKQNRRPFPTPKSYDPLLCSTEHYLGGRRHVFLYKAEQRTGSVLN